MQKYESKITKSIHSARTLFERYSDLSGIAQMLAQSNSEQIEVVEVTPDRYVFKDSKGVEMGIQILERDPNKTIKLSDATGRPFSFTMWIQIKEVEDGTYIRVTVHIDVPKLLKILVKGKVQAGVDQIAEMLARN